MTAIAGKKLQTFRKFSSTMKAPRLLIELSDEKREALLHEVYKVAKKMKKLERLGEKFHGEVPDYRDLRKRAKKASGLLRQALRNVKNAVEVGEKLLFVVVCKAGEPRVRYRAQQNFQHVEDTLNIFIEQLDDFPQSVAAWIPPKMRSPAEKKLVKQTGCDRDDPYLAMPVSAKTAKTASFGHWFIHEAQALLWKHRRSMSREVLIIKELFKAAFGDTVTVDYVRQALRRLRTKGKGRKLAQQMQPLISLAEHYFDGRPITVTLTPPRPTTSRPRSNKASRGRSAQSIC